MSSSERRPIALYRPGPSEQVTGLSLIEVKREQLNAHRRRLERHRSAYYELFFVAQGYGRFSSQQQLYNFGPKDVFAVFPNRTALIESDAAQPLILHMLSMQGPDVSILLRLIGIHAHSPAQHGLLSAEAEAGLLRLGQLLHDDAVGHGLLLLSELYRLLHELRLSLGASSVSSDFAETRWLRLCLDMIHAQFGRVTVQDLAERTRMSRSYFSDRFTRSMGISPKNYIHIVKMKEAARLLRERRRSVSDIASMIGYSDVYAFSKAFKQFTSSSPTQYQQQAAANESLTAAFELPPIGELLLRDTFDDVRAGSAPPEYRGFGCTPTVRQAPDLVGHALFLHNDRRGVVYVERDFLLPSGSFRLLLRVRPGQNDSFVGIHLLDARNRYFFRMSLNDSATVSYTNGSEWVRSAAAYTAGTWNEVEILYDERSKACTLRMNHREVAYDAVPESSQCSPTSIRFHLQTPGYAYFDDLWIFSCG